MMSGEEGEPPGRAGAAGDAAQHQDGAAALPARRARHPAPPLHGRPPLQTLQVVLFLLQLLWLNAYR